MPSKSCELDVIPTKLLKEPKVLDVLLPSICDIMNTSLSKGTFVDSCKLAIVRPLLKNQGLDLVDSNYRQVSNLSFSSKVLEKLALQQFNTHCNNFHLMPDYQLAYRKGFICETVSLKLMNDLLWAKERQEVTVLMAIDLSADFDTVDHSVLLEVLKDNFGIHDNVHRWLETYLAPRQFKVNVGKEYSLPKDLRFSVPQGSCAGPVLYSALKKSFKPTGDNELHAINILESTAKDISVWMDANRLRMNASKTEFIAFGSKAQLNRCNIDSIKVSGATIHNTETVKYLGAYLDKELNLKHHITVKCQAAMTGLIRLKLMRHFLCRKAAETIALGIVMSHLDYANSIFIGLPKCELHCLQRIQAIAARIVLQKESETSATACLKKLHWLPVHLRIKHKVLTLIYKSLNNEAPLYLRNLLRIKGASINLRLNSHGITLEIPKVKRKTFATRSFSVQGAMWWNELPVFISFGTIVPKL